MRGGGTWAGFKASENVLEFTLITLAKDVPNPLAAGFSPWWSEFSPQGRLFGICGGQGNIGRYFPPPLQHIAGPSGRAV